MKTAVLKLLGLMALFFGLLSPALAVQSTIKLIFVFTPDGLNTALSHGESMKQYADRMVAATNEIYLRSGVNVTVTVVSLISGYNPPNTISIIDTTKYGQTVGQPPIPTDIGAVKKAYTDPTVQQWRDGAHADVVVVVGEYVALGGDIGGYSQICAGAGAAAVGITASNTYVDEDILAHELGHQMCANHTDGAQVNFGTNMDNCVGYYDAMIAQPQPFPVPLVTWKAPAHLEGAQPGYGDGPQAAWNAMNSLCPGANTAAVEYQCVGTNPCVLNGSGDAGTCWMDIGTTYVFFTPPNTSWQRGIAGGVNKLIGNGQCPKILPAVQFSNPLKTFNGYPFGDGAHNSAAVMNANAPAVAAFKSP